MRRRPAGIRPRLLRLAPSAFRDLAASMLGFGLIVGLIFPGLVLILGVPSAVALRQVFFEATLGAGFVVGLANVAMVRVVVGQRLKLLISQMGKVESALSAVAQAGGSPRCDPAHCHLPVDSADELGDVAAAFNRLVDAAAHAHSVEHAACELVTAVARAKTVDQLCTDAVDLLVRRCEVTGAMVEVGAGEAVPGRCETGLSADWGHAEVAAAVRSGLVDTVWQGVSRYALPVLAGAEVIGMVAVTSDRPVDPATRRLIALLADSLGVASEAFRLHGALAHTACHDALTGLANRAMFLERAAHALIRSRRSGRTPAVLMLDVDDFKTVNDSLGHAAGDGLLQVLADRLSASFREEDTPARLGGDEFAVLIEDSGNGAALTERLQRLLTGLTAPIEVNGRTVMPSVSVGVAVPAPGSTAESLLREADTALYAAKRAGKGTARMFDPSLQQAADRQLTLRSHFSGALERGELSMLYQPIVQLSTRRLVGVEGLMRWTCFEHGPIPPADFIPIAEETGLIHSTGQWALYKACAQARDWIDRFGSTAPYVAVNVSAVQIHDQDFVHQVDRALSAYRLPPGQLLIELTESVMLSDEDTVLDRLRALRERGLRLALDDFGTGFSSLSYLQRMPVDLIKLDKSFVDELGRDGASSEVIRSLLQLTQALGLTSVAEGIEHHHQADRLAALQCELGQGYLFGHPVTAAEIDHILVRQGGVSRVKTPAAS